MADFWSGFSQGFLPAYTTGRARTDREQELKRARQQRLADLDTVRQQRLGDMATDRQQRLDDLAAANARQDRITAAARKYSEGRERRKIRAALQSFDPSVSKQAMEEAFFAQPREEQEGAVKDRGGFEPVDEFGYPTGEPMRVVDPSRMKGKVGYPDLGEEGTWGASARAARLQVTADAAKKIRADLAAEGNKYGMVQEPGEIPAQFAQRVQVAKNEAEINLARGKAGATAGGTKRGSIGPRADATLGYIASIDAGGGGDNLKNTKEYFAQRDENGVILTDENGEIVDGIDKDTGLPDWQVFLASPAVHDEMKALAGKYAEYRGVFGRSPKMLPDDIDNRGAAITRLQAEIDREKAEQEDDRKIALKKEMDALPKPVLAQLDKLRKAYHAEGADQQAILGNTALLLGGHFGSIFDKEKAEAFLESGKLPSGEVGGKAPTETAEERKSRLQFQHGIIRLDDLIQEADENDFTGLFPQLKSKLLDEVLPALTIDKYADWDRMTFRHRASILSQNLLRALNEEGRLSETDAVRILPLTPLPSDDSPMFKAKLQGIRELLVAKLKLQDATAGREDVFSLEPVDFFSKLGQPNEAFGGTIVIPKGMAAPIIKTMPQYKFIGGDKTKPVTFGYIMGQQGLTDEQKRMWILGADIPLPRR